MYKKALLLRLSLVTNFEEKKQFAYHAILNV